MILRLSNYKLQTISWLQTLYIFLVIDFISCKGEFSRSKQDSCELVFNSKQSMGYELGTQLQVCCDVNSVKLWDFTNKKSHKTGTIVYEQRFTTAESEAWSELQLSKCTDRPEATIGYVDPKPGVNCTYLMGQTLNIQQKNLPMPEWYVICFEKSSTCQSCRLDAICDNDLSQTCSDVNIMGSATTSTNSSIKYWYTVGANFPFADVSSVEVTVSRQRTLEKVFEDTKAVKAGQKVHLNFTGLLPAEWYIVKRCLVIKLPETLMNSQQFTFDNKMNKLCVEDSYRTENLSINISLFLSLFVVITMFVSHQ